MSVFTDGQAYERLIGRWSRAAGAVFLDWLSLPKGLDWLDVGCGTGAFTELVIDRCAPSNITGVDPAEDQIAYARNRPAAERATFRIAEAQSLPFVDREFDVAAMALVISFVPDAAKAVAEMKRVVRAKGTVAACMWDILGGGFIQRPSRGGTRRHGCRRASRNGSEEFQHRADAQLVRGSRPRSGRDAHD